MFKHRLALRLGRTVEELEASISHQELVNWQGFNLIEPIGDNRQDIQFAALLQLLTNIYRKPQTEPYPLSEFLFNWGQRQLDAARSKEEIAQECQAAMTSVFSFLNRNQAKNPPLPQASSQI